VEDSQKRKPRAPGLQPGGRGFKTTEKNSKGETPAESTNPTTKKHETNTTPHQKPYNYPNPHLQKPYTKNLIISKQHKS